MGKVTQKIQQIMQDEKLSLTEVYEKYPHLVDLQKEEMFEEYETNYSLETQRMTENKKNRQLLKG